MERITEALTLLATIAEPLTRVAALVAAVNKTVATASAAGRDLTEDELSFIRGVANESDDRWQGVLARLRAGASTREPQG